MYVQVLSCLHTCITLLYLTSLARLLRAHHSALLLDIQTVCAGHQHQAGV